MTPAPARDATRGRSASALSVLLAAVAIGNLVLYVGVALARIRYPFELEWIEAGMLEGARRVAIGAPLYAAPSLEYVAFNYTPLYMVLAAPLVAWLGPDLLALRILSFAASLGCLALIFEIVRRETGDRLAGILAAGLFAACYRRGGAWLDVARPDSLYLLWLLAGIAVIAFDRSRNRGPLIAGALFALAYLTKQTALMVALPIAAALIVSDRRRALPFLAAFLLAAGGVSLAWELASRGWFHYFVFVVAGRHKMSPELIPVFWIRDLLPALPIALLLAIAGLHGVRGASRWPEAPRRRWLYAGVAAGLFLSSWWLRCYPGGYENVLMTAHAAIAILFGFGFAWTLASGRPLERKGLAVLWTGVVLIQFGLLAYDPRAQVPSGDEVKRGRQLIRIVSSVPGEVLVPSHVALAPSGGKPRHFHGMAISDVLRDPGPTGIEMANQLEAALRRHRYPLIILNRGDLLWDRVLVHYALGARITRDSTGFWMPTGMHTRPEYLAVPKTTEQGP